MPPPPVYTPGPERTSPAVRLPNVRSPRPRTVVISRDGFAITRARVDQVMDMYNVSRSEARRMFPTVNLEQDDTPNYDDGDYDFGDPEANDRGD